MSRYCEAVPRADGFRMPAEFGRHDRCWIQWPVRPDNWRLGAKPAQRAFAALASLIARFESVTMAVPAGQFRHARRVLDPRVRVVEMSYDDSWVRDSGPTFVIDNLGNRRAVKWQFNAWGGLEGGLYFPWDLDDQVGLKIAEIEDCDIFEAPFVLEGGSIEVDGEGMLMVTEECLLNPNRNPALSREQIEELLRNYLGVRKIVWLPRGVYNDETNGHVDNFCRFVRPGVVALTWTDDTSDPQYEISAEAFDILSRVTDLSGRRLEVFKIHQPDPVLITADESEQVDHVAGTLPRQPGDRLPASYLNFYLPNGAVVYPTFHDPHDQAAGEMLAILFPGRQIIGFPSHEILLGGGNIHCVTQQVPAVSAA